MKVHSVLGPGVLESAYQACLAHELRSRGLQVATEVPFLVVYEGYKLEAGYRIDLIVEKRVVVEVKSAEAIHPIHEAQLLSYMRLSGIPVGLLINFNVLRLRDGSSVWLTAKIGSGNRFFRRLLKNRPLTKICKINSKKYCICGNLP